MPSTTIQHDHNPQAHRSQPFIWYTFDGAAQSGLIQPYDINFDLIAIIITSHWCEHLPLPYYPSKFSMWYHFEELVIVSCTAPLQRVVTVSMILWIKSYISEYVPTNSDLRLSQPSQISTNYKHHAYIESTPISRRCISDVFIDRGGFLTMVQRYY